MKDQKALIPEGQIERSILMIRGQKVIMDSDLAILYGVETRRLNEQVKEIPIVSPKISCSGCPLLSSKT